ncbi:hypothetical protein Tco_1446610 [Tanacetum coccineum]
MSTHEQQTSTISTSVVRNTGGKSGPQNLEEPTSNEALRELCDKNYHQLLPLISEKMQKEKEQQDKLKAVKARLLYGNESGRNLRNHEESHYSESKTPIARGDGGGGGGRRGGGGGGDRTRAQRRHWAQALPQLVTLRHCLQKTPSTTDSPHLGSGRGRGGCVQIIDWNKEPGPRITTVSDSPPPRSKSEDLEGGHWKSKSKRHRSDTYEDDLSQPWTCEERNPFTTRIQYFDFPRTRMPSHVKTYGGSGDPEVHIKLFQSAAKTERWAMPTWCHMFNSTLTGNARVWFDKLLKESIDSYEDQRAAFRENYRQQTKHI